MIMILIGIMAIIVIQQSNECKICFLIILMSPQLPKDIAEKVFMLLMSLAKQIERLRLYY